MQLDKGDYPENLHVVFCPNEQRSFLSFFSLFFFLFFFFEAFMCLGIVSEHKQSFLFQIFVIYNIVSSVYCRFLIRIILWQWLEEECHKSVLGV